MIDYGNDAAEKAIKKLDKRIQDVYREAEQDLQKKMDEFIRKYKIKEQKYLEQVAEGKISQADFDAWKQGQIFQGKQWRTKQRSIADVLYRSGEVSTKMINEMALGVCAENVNWAAYTIEHGFGVNFGFNLYDESTVANLIKKEPDILPKWKIDEEKNYIWNKKKLNNAVTQGIIQGEKLDEIAKRVAVGLSGSDQNLMKTFAKTAMTGAQNSGRNISYKNAQKLGINLKKEWVATLDMRTRSSHRKLDGEKAEIDEPFESEYGEIMFPGDPSANAADVYNCRCTMIADLVDYPAEEYERYDNIDGKPVKGMSYEDWAEAKKNGEDITVTGKQAVKKEKRVVQFVPAETIAQAIQRANEYGVLYAQFDGMEIERVNNILEAIEAMPKETRPKLVGNGKDVEAVTGRKLGRKSDQWYGVTYDYRPFPLNTMRLGYETTDYEGGIVVGINTTKFKTIDKLTEAKEIEQAKYQAKTGREWFWNTNGAATPHHEMGHCVWDVYGESTQWHINGKTDEWGRIAERWADESKCDILKNKEEAFAEAWAAVKTSGRMPPDYVVEFIKGI